MRKRAVKYNRDETRLYAWSKDWRATAAHIRAAIDYALSEKREIASKGDKWYANACEVSRRWRDDARRKSIKQLARKHLEYWRMRARSMSHLGPIDRDAYLRWQKLIPTKQSQGVDQ